MKSYIIFIFVGLLFFTTSIKAQEVNALLGDQGLVLKEINCILGKEPCDALGRQILRVLPEALNNNCNKCTPYQARNARRLISFMREAHPYEWNLIVQRYSNYRG